MLQSGAICDSTPLPTCFWVLLPFFTLERETSAKDKIVDFDKKEISMFTVRKCLSQKINIELLECFISRKWILLKTEDFILSFICIIASPLMNKEISEPYEFPSYKNCWDLIRSQNIQKWKVTSRVEMSNGKPVFIVLYFSSANWNFHWRRKFCKNNQKIMNGHEKTLGQMGII